MSRKSKTENAAKLINIINTLIERQEKLLDYVQYLEEYCAALEGTEIDNTLVGQEIEDEVMKEILDKHLTDEQKQRKTSIQEEKSLYNIDEILDENGVWCCQISYLVSMLKYNNFYDICHEHLSYYSIETFERLLNDTNLKCFFAETNDVNGGSIRLFICKKSNKNFSKDEYLNKINDLKD